MSVSLSSVCLVRGPFCCPASVSRCTAVTEAGQVVLSGNGAEVLPEILSWENAGPKWQRASEEVPVDRVPKSPRARGPLDVSAGARGPAWPRHLICTPGDWGRLPPSRGPATRRDTPHNPSPWFVPPPPSGAFSAPKVPHPRPPWLLAPSPPHPPQGPTVASSPPLSGGLGWS